MIPYEVSNLETADAVADLVVDQILHHPHNVFLCAEAARRRVALDAIARRLVRQCAQNEFGRVFAVLDDDGDVVGASVWAGLEPRTQSALSPAEEDVRGRGRHGSSGGVAAYEERASLRALELQPDLAVSLVGQRCTQQCDDSADDCEECCEERCDKQCFDHCSTACYEGCYGATAGIWRCALDRRRTTSACQRAFGRNKQYCTPEACEDRESATESCRRFCACTDENCGEGVCDSAACSRNATACSADGCAASVFCCWSFWAGLLLWFAPRSIAASFLWFAKCGWCTYVVAAATTLKLLFVLGWSGVEKRSRLVIELRRMRRRAANEVARAVAADRGVDSERESGAERWKRQRATRPQLLNLVYLVVRDEAPRGGARAGAPALPRADDASEEEAWEPNGVRAALLAAIDNCGPFRTGARAVMHCSCEEEQRTLEGLGFRELAQGEVWRGEEMCELRTLGYSLRTVDGAHHPRDGPSAVV
jgi:hypothetical protein